MVMRSILVFVTMFLGGLNAHAEQTQGETVKGVAFDCESVHEKVANQGLKITMSLRSISLNDATKTFESSTNFRVKLKPISYCEKESNNDVESFRVAYEGAILMGTDEPYFLRFPHIGVIRVPVGNSDETKVSFGYFENDHIDPNTFFRLNSYVPVIASLMKHAGFESYESQNSSLLTEFFSAHRLGVSSDPFLYSPAGAPIGVGSRLGSLYQIHVKSGDVRLAK